MHRKRYSAFAVEEASLRARGSGSELRGRVGRALGCVRGMMEAWKDQCFTGDGGGWPYIY